MGTECLNTWFPGFICIPCYVRGTKKFKKRISTIWNEIWIQFPRLFIYILIIQRPINNAHKKFEVLSIEKRSIIYMYKLSIPKKALRVRILQSLCPINRIIYEKFETISEISWWVTLLFYILLATSSRLRLNFVNYLFV